jgi:hypothetical protein
MKSFLQKPRSNGIYNRNWHGLAIFTMLKILNFFYAVHRCPH